MLGAWPSVGLGRATKLNPLANETRHKGVCAPRPGARGSRAGSGPVTPVQLSSELLCSPAMAAILSRAVPALVGYGCLLAASSVGHAAPGRRCLLDPRFVNQLNSACPLPCGLAAGSFDAGAIVAPKKKGRCGKAGDQSLTWAGWGQKACRLPSSEEARLQLRSLEIYSQSRTKNAPL